MYTQNNSIDIHRGVQRVVADGAAECNVGLGERALLRIVASLDADQEVLVAAINHQ